MQRHRTLTSAIQGFSQILQPKASTLLSSAKSSSKGLKTFMAEAAPAAKKQKMDQKIIGTHNGTFHCDEALAVYLLRQTKAYRDAGLKRSRDPAVLDSCDIVVDVGAVYDESKQRFDHHQRGFEEVFGHGFSTKLSSAGLVYKHFGKEIIASTTGSVVGDSKVTTLWLKLYKEFIEAIDAIDNGISQFWSQGPPKYRNRTDLSSRVGWLNPPWNKSVDSQEVDELFLKASKLTGEEFMGRLDYYANAWLPARDLIISGLSTRQNVDPSGKIVLFEQFAPWKEHLFELEAEQEIEEDSKPVYIIYPDETAANWRIQAVPVSPESFESRKALPEKWRGLRDDELSKESGIDGGIFVHASGFIGGNKTKEGALSLAKLALTM
ncbi:GAMM1 protein [Leucogyrophana mollusca]|uniref:GAMM1 protein n=1 Tax=Leucogyrophana mollusca TaxID=85980 RepID=A0ACB8BZE4_9AGAM|nr:GAMM1 protein [Leucogyrophana mollusca]